MSLPIMICCWKKINKKGRNSFVPNLQHFQFGLDVWKNRTFFLKIIWIWTCSEIFKKFRYGEDLLLFWMMSNIASGHLLIIFTQERAPWETLTYSNSILETLKNCEKCSKLTIKLQKDFLLYFLLALAVFYTFFIVSAVDCEQNAIKCSNNKLLQ